MLAVAHYTKLDHLLQAGPTHECSLKPSMHYTVQDSSSAVTITEQAFIGTAFTEWPTAAKSASTATTFVATVDSFLGAVAVPDSSCLAASRD